MSPFRREKKRPDRRMVWVTTSTHEDGGDKRFVLKIRKASVPRFRTRKRCFLRASTRRASVAGRRYAAGGE